MNSTSISNSCVRELISISQLPVVLFESIDWNILKWTLEDWSNAFQNKQLSFRCGTRICRKTPIWESQCKTEYHSFKEFIAFSKSEGPINKKWWYFDYKHISDHFAEREDIFTSISWSGLGFSDKGAKHSTIWIGSPGAHTPCHFDSYGCNIVAQVLGKKRWILFPPSETENLKPTRVPYEESSIYSNINFNCSKELKKNLKFNKCFVVDLNPGEVLLIPPKWWHYVENLSTAISVNMWIPVKDDDNSRLDEALVRYFISCIVNSTPNDLKNFLLNPNELDMKIGTIDLDIISFCKKKVKEDSETNPIQKQIDPVLVSSHCHNYKVIRPISPSEFRNTLLECSNAHCLYSSDCEELSENHVNTLTSMINAFCHPDIICQIRNKFLNL